MTTNTKLLESFVEYVISDQEDKAKEAFHQYIVEFSANYHKSLMEGFGESSANAELEEFKNNNMESLQSAYESTGGAEAHGDFDSYVASEYAKDDEDDGEEEAAKESRIDDLEDSVAKLQREFDQLMAEEAAEDENEEGEEEGEGEEDANGEMPQEVQPMRVNESKAHKKSASVRARK